MPATNRPYNYKLKGSYGDLCKAFGALHNSEFGPAGLVMDPLDHGGDSEMIITIYARCGDPIKEVINNPRIEIFIL